MTRLQSYLTEQFLDVLVKGSVKPNKAKALISALVKTVPIVELDLADAGVVLLYGPLQEGEIVEIQSALSRTHLNLDNGMPLSINLSNVFASSFSVYSLRHTINEIRRDGRR